jgi:DNA sulfur modification protein DndB
MKNKIAKVMRRRVNERTYYFGAIPSSLIKVSTFVPVLENSPKTALIEITEEGYQRPGSMPRMNKFKQFLKENPNSLVPPVILSGRGRWKYEGSNFDPDIGVITIEGPAAIIDGQHRMGGYVALYDAEKIEVEADFLLIENLTKDEEVREFIRINDSQVGVPKSLGTFISSDNPHLTSKIGGDYVKIAWGLSTDQASPFLGRITRTKIGPEHLFALHSIATQLEKMFSHGAFSDSPIDKKMEIALKYWNIIQDAHPTEFDDISKLGIPKQGKKSFDYKILELTGFIAWSQIGYQILGGAYNPDTEEVNWESVESQIDYLSGRIDWRKDGQYKNATGLVGGPQIRIDMERALQIRT